MNIANTGTLIIGEPRSGKSTLALSLIRAGYSLIADDAPEFHLEKDKIFGKCPDTIHDCLFINDLGILNIRKLFGDKSITIKKELQLIINLTDKVKPNIALHNLQLLPTMREIFDKKIPEFSLHKNSRHITTLVECLVKNFQLQKQGCFAHVEFPAVIPNECEGSPSMAHEPIKEIPRFGMTALFKDI